MKLETFFEKFDLFADAPNAVAKLRELVLQLAVRGRLFSSSSPDSLLPSDLSRPFDIPKDWQWIALNKAADCRAASKVDSASLNESDWVLDLEDIDGGVGRIIAMATFAERRSLSTKSSFQKGDVLYGKLRPYLNKVVIADRPGFCTTEIIPLRPNEFVASGYLRLFLRSPHFLRYAASKNYGMKMPRLGTQDLESAMIPLPPLAEQKRIVAKVDELMALCDRLEAQQQERETRHAALARASLARFADAPTPANLNFLFHPSFNIHPSDLRKSILTLAVQGKLVPQDPTDEDALTLLGQIAAHKAALAKEGNLRGSTTVKPMADDEAEFEIPSNWCWVRFGEIMVNRDGERIPVSKEERETKAKTYDYYGASGVIDKIDGYLFDKPLLLIGEDGANLINRSTPIAFIARGKYWVNNHAHVLDGISEVFLQFAELHINAINLEKYVTGSAQPKMNQAKMNSIPIALPPLAEQKRIVAKVEQLMALVDTLETQLNAACETAGKLMEAAVAELTGGGGIVKDEEESMNYEG